MLIRSQSASPVQRFSPSVTEATVNLVPADQYQPGLPQGEPDIAALARRLKVKSQPAVQNQFEEAVSDFPGRKGYQSEFLGSNFSLPKLDPSIRDKAATLIGKPDQVELKYTNFSIVMNKERRQAFYTAVNIDGARIEDHSRDGIRWTIDGRIPREHQLGNEAYSRNPIDRGHMVRRRDPVWGPDAAQANADTFAFTNAGLQHGSLNQKTWLDLENYILDQAKSQDQKLTVLTGPVFADDDPEFDNRGRMDEPTKIPQEFWKMVVWNDPDEGLKGAAFIQSQKDYVGRRLFKTDFDPGQMSVYQLPIDKLEAMTKLDFGELNDTVRDARAINQPEDVSTGLHSLAR